MQTPPTPPVPPALVLLLAGGTGLAVASLYYSQPILGILGADLGAGDRAIGMIPMLTQLGYAIGMVLLAPLGDRYERRAVIVVKSAGLALALLLCGLAPDLGALLAGSLVVGLTATLTQDFVPAAATLAPDTHRGRIVGTVMSGLLLGILLSRVVSGLVAEHFGWRSIYLAASMAIALVGVASRRALPRFKPTTRLGYGALIGSMLDLWRRHRALRLATWSQGLLSVGFSAFWSSLAVMLHERFHLGSAVAGAFGLAGVAGALAASLAGRISDRRGPEIVTRLGAGFAALSFAAMGLSSLAPPRMELGLIALTAVAFDFGVQASLVAHQTIIYAIDADARSRLNAVLVTGMFIGMATGAGLGSLALSAWGWPGVTGLATVVSIGALLVRVAKGVRSP